MCGIVAIKASGCPVSPAALARATLALDHRGPDARGRWISPGGDVGLGHARLSIIDPATGDQPIANEDEQLHVVVNGDFYDYARFQRELIARRHRLRTRSDSEILLHLYEEYGMGCLKHLRGEFAFALWDERNNRLFAARDRFGIKPLYYGRFEDTLYLASEAKALFAAGMPARWDHDSLFQELCGIPGCDRSLFQGVHQVPPGHYMIASGDEMRLVPYWDVYFPTDDDRPAARSETENVELVRDGLREAVRLRLQADVPVGCYLSAGLDSGAILGIASELRNSPVDAFTIAFDESQFDEGPAAEEMAAHAGANFHRFTMPESLLAEHWAESIAHCETIHWNANCAAKYLLSRHVRDAGFKVVLTGDGSDELMGGYAFFRTDMLRCAPRDEATPSTLAAVRDADVEHGLFGDGSDASRRSLAAVDEALGYVPEFVANAAARAATVQPLLSSDFRAQFGAGDPYRILLDGIDVSGRMRGRSVLHQTMYLWLKTHFPNKLLNYLGDRTEMAHSVEGRTPFLDHHLVETVAAMPAEMKINGPTAKYVLREAARPHVTDAAYRRDKHPFLAPIVPKSDLLELAQHIVRDSAFGNVPFFDQKTVVAVLDDPHLAHDKAGLVRLSPLVMLLASVSVVQERYRL